MKNPDDDLERMNRVALTNEVLRLRNGIRYHQSQKMDSRCWLDDFKLYELLPETPINTITLPAKDEFLGHCEKFWECRQGRRFKDVDEVYKDWEKDKPY